MPNSPYRLTATEALDRIAAGDLTARAWTESCLDRIEALDGEVRAFVHVDPAGARKAAAEVDAGRRKGPLAGAPFAAKDIIDTHDMPTA
ncbi:MAG: amidase family protein, partial [Alphaproteobacteria bacterium]